MFNYLKKDFLKILKRFIFVLLLLDLLHWNAKIKTILAFESLLCFFFLIWILKAVLENSNYSYYLKINIKLKYIHLLKKITYNYKFYKYKAKEKKIIIMYILLIYEKSKFIKNLFINNLFFYNNLKYKKLKYLELYI